MSDKLLAAKFLAKGCKNAIKMEPTASTADAAKAPGTGGIGSELQKLLPEPRTCPSCNSNMSTLDGHTRCRMCLGQLHFSRALNDPNWCEHCNKMPRKRLARRVKRFLKDNPSMAAGAVEEAPEEGSDSQVQNLEEQFAEPAVADWAAEPMEDLPDLQYPLLEAPEEANSSGEDVGDGGGDSYYSSSSEESYEDEAPLPAAQPSVLMESQSGVPAAGAQDPASEISSATLTDLMKRAADRLNLDWPLAEEEAGRPSSLVLFQGSRGAATPTRVTKVLFPVHESCAAALSTSWKNPYGAPIPSLHAFHCAGMKEGGWHSMPQVEPMLANHLLNKGANTSLKKCGFVDKNDRDFSALNGKAYSATASVARALNASAILLGSATKLQAAAGDNPNRETMAEMRKITDELLVLTQAGLESAGRAMAFQVVMERSRWLEHSRKTPAEKQEFLEQELCPTGLFGGALPAMMTELEVRQKEKEALEMYLPRKAPPPAPPRQYAQVAAAGAFKRPQQPQTQAPKPPGNKNPNPGAWKGRKQSASPMARGGGAPNQPNQGNPQANNQFQKGKKKKRQA